jgi:hypothetical protein
MSPAVLPVAYQLPAAILLIVGGLVACFVGYRLFKFVLGIFGFILGALAASSIWGASDTTYMVITALVGGLVGSVLLLLHRRGAGRRRPRRTVRQPDLDAD